MAQLRAKPKGATPSNYRREWMVVAFGLASLLSLLLASAFVNERTPSFLIISLGIVVAALLFRFTERSRRALEQRVEELATLNSVGQAISSSLAQPDLLQILSDEIRRLMDPPTFYVALYAPDTQVLTFPYVIHNGVRAYWTPRLSGTGEPEYIIKTRRPLLLQGAVRAQFLDLGVQAVGPESRCFLSVPLIADGEVLGVLVAQHGQNEEAFGASEMAFMTTLSTQAAIALRNANLFKRVSEMADKLALLNNVSSVVTASLDLDSVLNTICNVVIEVGYADKTGIFLLSEDGSTLRLAYSIGLSEDYVAQFQEIAQNGDSGLFQIAQQSALMVFSDVRTDPLALGWRTLAEIEGYTAMLTVPLTANEQVIGLLAAFYQQPHTFIKSELDLMTTLANQVAVTVANARLYQDTQVRAREMMQLAEASRVFTASLDLPSVAEKVLDQLQALLAPDMIALLLANNAGENLQALRQRGIEPMDDATPVGSIRRAIAACKPMMLPEESADLAFLTQYNMVNMYAIPMVSQDKAFGVVLIGHRTVRRYHVRERQLAEALVNLAATSVRNAQLYSQTDAALADRVIELSAIEAISRNISGQLDLEGIITDVLDLALEVTQADAAGCALVSEEAPDHLSFVERYSLGEKVTGSPQAVDRKSGIIGRVMRTGVLARVADVRDDADYMNGLTDILSELCVPIVHKGERVGVINLESRRLDAFTASHERFLINLADHAAIAIGNARLFDERQRQIDTLIKLRDLSLELLSADSLKTVLRLIVEYTLMITRAKDVHLYLYDAAQDNLTFGASMWWDGREDIEAKRPSRDGRTWQAARTGQMLLIPEMSKLQNTSEYHEGRGLGGIARLPLKRADQVFGVLIIAFRDVHYFTDNEVRVLDLVASQAAIAIENSRLFEAVRAGRDRMQAILDSTRDGILLLDDQGTLLLANRAAERLLARPLLTYVGQKILRLLVKTRREEGDTKYPDLIKEAHSILAEIKKAPDGVTRRTFQISQSTGARDIEETTLPVRNEAGRVAGLLLVLRDISEEKSMERFRDEITQMLIHDLRSPLGSVITSLRYIQDRMADNDYQDLDQVMEIAINSSENQMRMIESLLEIAKLETGRVPVSMSSGSLSKIAAKAITALTALAHESEIRMENRIPPDFPPVCMDEELILRVLSNLLDNALRHTPVRGQVRIEAERQVGRNFALISVIDTGKGILPDVRERIFEKFVQVPKSALRGHRGSGLGLTFCKLVVEAHGGQIWVDSGPEGGAAFRFTLPFASVTDSKS